MLCVQCGCTALSVQAKYATIDAQCTIVITRLSQLTTAASYSCQLQLTALLRLPQLPRAVLQFSVPIHMDTANAAYLVHPAADLMYPAATKAATGLQGGYLYSWP